MSSVREMVARHIAVAAAAISWVPNVPHKYVDVLVPTFGFSKYSPRYLIDIRRFDKYEDECVEQMKSAVRGYLIETKHIPNWSDQCLWCAQGGRCKLFRESRADLRGVVQRI